MLFEARVKIQKIQIEPEVAVKLWSRRMTSILAGGFCARGHGVPVKVIAAWCRTFHVLIRASKFAPHGTARKPWYRSFSSTMVIFRGGGQYSAWIPIQTSYSSEIGTARSPGSIKAGDATATSTNWRGQSRRAGLAPRADAILRLSVLGVAVAGTQLAKPASND